MNISPVINYSYSRQAQQNNNINFKNYSETFRKALTTPINNKKDAEKVFNNLIKSKENSFVIADWFNTLYAKYKDNMEPLLKILKELQQNGPIITDTDKNIAYAQKDSVLFIGTKRDESIEFSLNKNKSIQLTRDIAGNSEIIKFYPNSETIASKTKINGSGLGQTSETTYYNADGSKKHLRNIINSILGI